MGYLEWIAAYETGIPAIDYDHQELVSTLNEIQDLFTAGVEPQTILSAVSEFYALAMAHFALEEKIMQDESYAGLSERKDLHRRILDELDEIQDAYEEGMFEPESALPAKMRTWLVEAITADAKLFSEFDDAALRRWGLKRG